MTRREASSELVCGSKPVGSESVPQRRMLPAAEAVGAAESVGAGVPVVWLFPPQPARAPMSMAPARDRDSHFFTLFMEIPLFFDQIVGVCHKKDFLFIPERVECGPTGRSGRRGGIRWNFPGAPPVS